MSFSRKRVALACSFCRHRKRRCDAAKPNCQNCVEADVECQYDDTPSQRIDTSGGSREILTRLRQIETMLDTNTQAVTSLSSELVRRGKQEDAQGASPLSHTSSLPSIGSRLNVPIPTWPTSNDYDAPDSPAIPPLDIPVKHKTSSNYLLGLPAMKALVGEYPTDLFFLIESRHALPPELSFERILSNTPSLDISQEMADYLVSVFFTSVHPNHPVLDESSFRLALRAFLENGIDSSVESALCLIVLGLGTVAMASPDSTDFSSRPPGMEYIQQAMPTLLSLSSWSFTYSVILAQALVLSSVYFAYIVRPLQSWRLIYSASTILQFKLSGFGVRDDGTGSRESILRLVWSSFLVECDRLAELELPRSGLQQLIDETSLPSCNNLEEMQSTCFLAELSIRRLLNRTHNSLYPRKQHVLTLSSTSLMAPEEFSTKELASMVVVCDELQRQLDLWHTSIPEPHRPTLALGPTRNDRESVLRIRYFAARHIIYRPFVLNITMNETAPHEDYIIQRAALCIESCRLYVRSATSILSKPSPYTWTFSLSSLGAIIVLTLSSLSPSLKHLVPDIDELQTLAIHNIRPWAISSLGTVVAILEDMQRKQRILSAI